MLQVERIRRTAGVSRAELARRAGMNAATVGQIESGYIGRPYASQLVKLANALGLPEDQARTLLEEAAGDAD